MSCITNDFTMQCGLFLIWKCGLTAFIVNFDTTHNWIMLHSIKGGSSKTFAAQVVKSLRIKDTMKSYTSITGKSWGGDRKQMSDCSIVLDEMSSKDLDPQ